MSYKGKLVALLIAIFAALASKHFINTSNSPFLNLVSTFSSPIFSTTLVFHGHQHHHHKKKNSTGSICDDIFPPPDTNTTSMICVDRNGCCNFTTVQSAVDAVGVLSQKRTIIWINNGIYL